MRPRTSIGALLMACAALLLLVACDDGEEELVIQEGDLVAVHYTGTLDDGEQFDSSAGGEPLEFVAGIGRVVTGFDRAVLGMREGETKRFRLEPEEAYGERREDLILNVPFDSAPEGLQVGDTVPLSSGGVATVIAIDDESVTVDANHQLAGQALTFEIEVVRVIRESASEDG